MYPKNPKGTQVFVGSMNIGYDIYYIRHCQDWNPQPVPYFHIPGVISRCA